MTPPGPTILQDEASAIVIDEQSWPIWRSTWFGAATERLVSEYFARMDLVLRRARSQHERVVMVTDTYLTEAASARVRQRIGELSRSQTHMAQDLVVASFTIIENPVIRGVVTALSWIDPQMMRTTNVGSFDAAIVASLAALRAARIPAPEVLPTRHADPRVTRRAG